MITSRSAVSAYQMCPRKRYWNYEAANGTGTPGWERKRLSLPLVTGIYVHKGLELALKGSGPAEAAGVAKAEYLAEVTSRGLAVEEDSDEAAVIDEQAAHVEALVLAWCRVRLPRWQEEYEVVEVEVEDRVPLAKDVTLAVRADAIVRRRYDHRMFVVNFKTVAQADERWLRGWEVDMQLMTELLAAERRHGSVFGGVIIEGLIKGRRMPEKDNVGTVTGYRDTTPLLYGYKCDAVPPFTPLQYQWDYTRRKGWYRFPVWKEQQLVPHTVEPATSRDSGKTWLTVEGKAATPYTGSPLEYWINWLPEEVVEQQFTVVPPIMRDEVLIASKVVQIVTMERNVRAGVMAVESGVSLDATFPQNERSCIWPSRCEHFDTCWTANVADDMAGSGLYRPRVDHHARGESE